MRISTRIVLLLLLLAAPATFAADRPALVVVISIDQFRYDYLTRFAPYFAPDGFRRFLDRGATFSNAKYSYATVYTGPGHAAIGTGRVPAETGIIANTWFDRVRRWPEYCVADERAAGGFSPVNLQSDSLGDRLQERFSGARVFAVSIKDRAAILMAGRKATSVYWFDPAGSGFTSSSYYHANATLTAEYNKTIPEYLHQHSVWEQSTFIPAADLAKVTHDPESLRKYKTRREGLGVSFPHPIRTIDALTYTPFGNGLVINFVERLVETEHLGSGSAPDLLFIGLSSPDYLGHNFGPDSLEVADSVVRTDRDVAGLLQWLDERLSGRYVAVITSDHGVQSIPEVARDMGRDAGRVSMRNPGANIRTFAEFADVAPDRVQLEKSAGTILGHPLTNKSEVSEELIGYFEEPSMYLNWTRIAELKLDGERVKRAFRDAALALRGVSAAFTNSELLTMRAPASDIEAAVRRTFRADRSGDVIVTLKPGYIWDYTGTGTTHGQPVEDDQHVPVMFWGLGIAAGRFDSEAEPTDIARTIASLFGFEAGSTSSRVLPVTASSNH
jgi:arylsulfatase A-like enzyme